MFNMARYVELQDLLAELGAIEDRLMPHELEMLRSLKAKYDEPVDPDPFDMTALTVLRRNIDIRKGYAIDPKKDGGRVIDLPRTGPAKN
ncbi:MAG: hypothetical protein ACR2PM_12590 [Hyphomicrobiales bacterium]